MARNPVMEMLEGEIVIVLSPRLIRLVGGVIPAMIVSQAGYLSSTSGSRCDGWFPKSTEEWSDELGIGRREFNNARVRLNKLNILETGYGKKGRTYFYRLNFEQLEQLLNNGSCEAQSEDQVNIQTKAEQCCLHQTSDSAKHNNQKSEQTVVCRENMNTSGASTTVTDYRNMKNQSQTSQFEPSFKNRSPERIAHMRNLFIETMKDISANTLEKEGVVSGAAR